MSDMGRLWMFVATGAAILLLAVTYGLAYPKTEYAPGFSEAKFRQIRSGMNSNEVRQLVGKPLWRYTTGPVSVWVYSQDKRGGSLDLGYRSCFLMMTNGVLATTYTRWQFPWTDKLE